MAAADQERQISSFVELPDICREQDPAQGKLAAIIRKGGITREVTESASADFIARVMEVLAHA